MAGWTKMPLGTEVGLGPGDIVLHGASSPLLKGHSPQFSSNVRCDQTAGWTKMPLGTEVDLGPGDFLFHEDSATFRKKQPHPSFGPCLLWLKGWVYKDAISSTAAVSSCNDFAFSV